MIDPKLNEIVPETESTKSGNTGNKGEGSRNREGLSVKDTVAAGANLSTGARGVDTSGVSAGAGVGAGMTYASPTTAGESPAPAIVPGGSNAGAPAAAMPSTDTEVHSGSSSTSREGSSSFTSEEIAAHAYRCWHERGCPEGSSEVDWHRAEEELRRQRSKAAGA
jgi:hypothetical protein